MMNRFFTLLLTASCLTAVGQVDIEYPYNPDFENDGSVGIEDLMSLLSVYGVEFTPEELFVDGLSITEIFSAFQSYSDSLASVELVVLEQEQILDSLLINFNQQVSTLVDSITESIIEELAWSLNREACRLTMNGGSYTASLECQYIFAAAPNSGGGGTTLYLPESVPYSSYSLHVQASKSGVIACGTNGTGCPVLSVKTAAGDLIDEINLNQFNSPSGLAVQHRKYVWDNDNWIVISHAFFDLDLD